MAVALPFFPDLGSERGGTIFTDLVHRNRKRATLNTKNEKGGEFGVLAISSFFSDQMGEEKKSLPFSHFLGEKKRTSAVSTGREEGRQGLVVKDRDERHHVVRKGVFFKKV